MTVTGVETEDCMGLEFYPRWGPPACSKAFLAKMYTEAKMRAHNPVHHVKAVVLTTACSIPLSAYGMASARFRRGTGVAKRAMPTPLWRHLPSTSPITRPMVPSAAMGLRATEALTRDIAQKALTPRLADMHAAAVEQLCNPGASHALVDSGWLFSEELCRAALQEQVLLRSKEFRLHCPAPWPDRQDAALHACFKPWFAWVDSVFTAVGTHDRHHFGSPGDGSIGHWVVGRQRRDAEGGFWHADRGNLTSLVTLTGPATLFYPGADDDDSYGAAGAPKPRADVQRPERGQALLFSGSARQPWGFEPLAHRAPTDVWGNRLLLVSNGLADR